MAVYYIVDGSDIYYTNEWKDGYSVWDYTDAPEIAYGKNVIVEDIYFKFPLKANNLFKGCTNTTFESTNWDTSSCTEFKNTFNGCSNLETLDTGNWDMGFATTFERMFLNCTSLTGLNVLNWNVSGVRSIAEMFKGCSAFVNFNAQNWKTSLLQDTHDAFKDCTSLTTLDLSKWKVMYVTNFSGMFDGCSSLVTLYIRDWEIGGGDVDDVSYMFYNCSSLVTIMAMPNYDFRERGVPRSSSYMFYKCTSIRNWSGYYGIDRANSQEVGYFTPDPATRIWVKPASGSLYDYDYVITNERDPNSASWIEPWNFDPDDPIFEDKVVGIELTDNTFKLPADSKGLFYGAANTCFNDMYSWDFSECEDASYMFAECRDLVNEYTRINPEHGYEETIYFSTLGWDTSNCTDMNHMFDNCLELTYLDVNNWDVSNVTDMSYMFATSDIVEQGKLSSLNVDGWDVSSCTNMEGMFLDAPLTGTMLVLNDWDTSNVTNMSNMFKGVQCDIDASGFNTSHVTDMTGMFGGTVGAGTIDVSGYDTSHADCTEMFQRSGATTIVLGEFDLSATSSLENMFAGCHSLEEVLVDRGTDWEFSYPNLAPASNMFNECDNILNWDGTKDITRANNTKGNGYFGGSPKNWVLYEVYMKV